MPYTSASVEPYLQDASGYRGEAVEVFIPSNIQELRETVRAAAAQQIPLTVAGAGTGLTGARVPHGGYVVSLERFRKLEIEPGRARCGAGVLLNDLHQAAARTHQFFGPNPTEGSASIGGIFSTNAGGARSFRYGSVRYHTLAAEATFISGQTKRFEKGEAVDFAFEPVHMPAARKNSAGYNLQPGVDWVNLLAGSEGTLCIVTEMELKLLPEPPAILSGVVFFPSDEEALNAVEAWRSISELRLLEFMDGFALRLLRPRYTEIPARADAALLIEQNLESQQDGQVDLWAQRLAEQHALEETSWFGFSQSDQARFRDFRHTLPTMVSDIVRRNGFPKFSTDFAVPLHRYRELHACYKKRCGEVLPGAFTIFGHVGDANNHVNVLPQTPGQANQGEELMREFAGVVIAMHGTVAAEHGIGKTKT
ncbi:MAG: FAD-binding oxidoreductase, partial [Acidobacteriaceae bacterium]|nr:FAD-binding oxidoreductase [Acidobacteriaceae bacterium]